MKSLRTRLLVLLLALVAAASAGVGATTYRSVLAEADELFDYQLRQLALSLRDQGAGIGPPAASIETEAADVVVQIWSVDGAVVYASQPGLRLPGLAPLGYSQARVDGRDWRVFALATRSRVIQVGQPLQSRRTLAARAALRSVTPLLGLTPLLALAVWWIVRTSLAPLGPLSGALRRRAPDSLDPLPTDRLPTEVEPLVRALNGLLARLQEAFAAQRAFVADAAHELRSPLTALKLQLDGLRLATDEAARTQALADLGAGMQRTQRLVEQLLTLARAEPGGAPLRSEPLDLAECVRQACADALPALRAQGATLELDAPAPVPVRGESASLALLVRNLLDNAARYGRPPLAPTEHAASAEGAHNITTDNAPNNADIGAHIRVRVGTADDGSAWLQVDDAGPGIPAAERERVFDRFYRRDGQAASGSGLGLAIVQAIATRHDARLTLDDAPGGGLRVTVRLPTSAG